MSRYKDYLLEFSDKYNPNDINWLTDINNKILSKLFGKSKRIKIDTYDQFVFMWNFVCMKGGKRASLYTFLEFFDKEIYDRYKHSIEARISYSDGCKYKVCRAINSLFKDKEVNAFFSHVEIITSCYLDKNLDFLKKLNYLKNKNISESNEIYKVWFDSACIRSKDSNLYKKFFKKIKKEKGYMEKKYDLCINAIENNALDEEFVQIIANSLISSKCFDLVYYIKRISSKANSYKDKSGYGEDIKNKYNLDQLYSLCVLLVQKRGSDLCDLATSFLPKEYCTWILPFATQRKSTLNLKRRFGIQ